ncbi:apolipoprotein N-acyltransferase [Rubritalea spongiae]|uniref:Apolipoprotein N-acyltransferase n=1 Tax=Rubritalea spongiae TaxID=430797 RepID=A0ABW5E664_9BACT
MNTLKPFLPYLAATLSGVLLAMCFPGFEVSGSFVWIWSIPLMVGLWLGGGEKKRKRFGFKVGFVGGLAFWLLNVKWLTAMGDLPTVPVLGAYSGWLMLAVYLALYFGVWGMFAATVGNPWRRTAKVAQSGISEKMEAKLERPKRVGGFKPSMRVLGFAVINASAWVVLEWLRGWMLTGFGWNGLGVAFHEVPVVMQVADLVGVTGVAFIPMFMAAVMLQTGKRLIDEVRAGKFQAHFEIGIAVGVIAAVFAYGVNRMAYHSNAPFHGVRTLIIQENIKQTLKWDEQLEVEHYNAYVESIQRELGELDMLNQERMAEAVKTGEEIELEYPDLVVLPESATTQPLVYLPEVEGVYLPLLTKDLLVEQIYQENHFKTVFGANFLAGVVIEGEVYYDLEVGDAYNTFAVTGPEIAEENLYPTTALQTHGKNHLVPFGEYIPEVPLLSSIASMFSGMSYGKNFSSGGSFEPLTVELRGEDVQLMPNICFEDTVGRVIRKFVRDAPQMLVNITNDGWFGESEAARQHMANAKFRSVELRRPMARAANTGVSGIVDTIGSMVNPQTGELNAIGTRENPFIRDGLYATVKVPTQPVWTLYAVAGDWFVILCALMAFGGGAFLGLKR